MSKGAKRIDLAAEAVEQARRELEEHGGTARGLVSAMLLVARAKWDLGELKETTALSRACMAAAQTVEQAICERASELDEQS